MTNADRIRLMSDEDLAVFMVTQAIMGAMATSGINRSDAEKGTREIMESGEPQADVSETVQWLKQEVSEDAGQTY